MPKLGIVLQVLGFLLPNIVLILFGILKVDFITETYFQLSLIIGMLAILAGALLRR
jgi:uncharacterized membrane protein HdeD (DUF308 family)